MTTYWRHGAIAGLLLFGAAALVAGMLLLRPAAARLNVVLIVCDALRADHVAPSRYGEPLMPFLSALTKEGLYFTNAVTPCTWTRPAMTSVFSSLYPETHQVYFDHDPAAGRHADAPDDSIETIATVLKRAGYATIGIQTNGNLGPQFGYGRGYDVYEVLNGAPAEQMTQAALQRLREAKGRPYFLYLHYIDPHGPYTPPERYRGRFGQMAISAEERATALNFSSYVQDHCNWKLGWKQGMDHPPLSPAGRDAVRALYAGEVRYLDDQLRALLGSLPDRDNTCVIVTSDHGEGFWEHDYVAHALTCFGELTQVPLLFQGPGVAPALRTDPVETLSVLPTVAALLGLPAAPEWQGVNLLTPKNTRGRPVFSWTCGPWSGTGIERVMVQRDRWKLLLDRKSAQQMLFNVREDPAEQSDMAQSRPDIAASLRKLLDRHQRDAIAARGSRKPRTLQMDAETQRQLEELGYRKEGKK